MVSEEKNVKKQTELNQDRQDEKVEDPSSLEALFECLDEVTEKLEDGDISLEQSFGLYQRGMELLRQCNETIDMVEKRVQMLDEEGELHEF